MAPRVDLAEDLDSSVPDTIVGQKNSRPASRAFTWAEIRRHNKPDDCYIVIRGKVYAVHDFAKEHPGGDVILTYAGEDASDVFAAFHPNSTNVLLPGHCIGVVAEDSVEPASDFVTECRRLRTLFKEQGLMKSSKLYYTFKIASNLSILALSTYMALTFSHPAMIALSAVLLAIFWQQCGWLAHDFLHHQVFENRTLNNWAGFFVGDWWQGFSVTWWKRKHNTHHAVPNVHLTDPDVDLMPLLAWSEHALDSFMEGDFAALPKTLIDYQYLTYPVLLAFARMSWAIQSVLTVATGTDVPDRAKEAFFLALHYACYFGLMSTMSAGNAAIFFAVSNTTCGLLLALVFSLNHNGMPIFTHEEACSMDYFTRQVVTGRDVEPTTFNSWFSGGLNYQIEHHLFPNVPRHNFHKISPLVRSLCKKHNVSYHSTSFMGGTIEVFKRLIVVGKASQKVTAARK